jgi:hypothetical protein
MEPGVSGAACEGMPPGNENWRKNRCRSTSWYSSFHVPSSQAFAFIAGPPCPGPQMYRNSRPVSVISALQCAYTRFSAGEVPQWPSSRGLTSSGSIGRLSSGLSSR